MFAIENLWKIEALAPLQKAYEANNADQRIVIVKRGDDADVPATQALHEWLATFSYEFIPGTWETMTGEELPVVHVSKMTLKITRRNPFNGQPVPPHSWLSRLPQERFDALLLAQQQGNVPFSPNEMYITDTLRPALTADTLSEFWRKAVAAVQFAQSGAAAQNDEQRRLINVDWPSAMKRRHYDPAAVSALSSAPVPQVAVNEYIWTNSVGRIEWNPRMRELKDWIVRHVNSSSALMVAADAVMGTRARIEWTGAIDIDAHNLIREAMKHGSQKLSSLATYYNFVQTINGTFEQAPAPSAFDQTGQVVYGTQINTSGNRSVAVGRNINQTIIVTGDNNINIV